MSMNTQGRPTGIGTLGTSASGSALLPDEPLLFPAARSGVYHHFPRCQRCAGYPLQWIHVLDWCELDE